MLVSSKALHINAIYYCESNIMTKTILIVLLALGLTICAVQAAKLSTEQVASLAKRICKEPKKHQDDLTSVSSMMQLIDYFEDMPAKDKCRDRYLSSFRFLQVVLSVGNENVCGNEKVSLLEDFNRRYISTTHRDKHNQRESSLEAPETVKVFFVHYANKISSVCKESLTKVMEDSQRMFAGQDGQAANMENVDNILQGFLHSFALNPAKNGYKDLIMPWDLIDAFHVSEKKKKFLPTDAMVNDGVSRARIPVRLSIQVNGARNLWTMQEACATYLKPDYSKLALPVMRLLNLGLYESNEPMARQLSEDKNLRRLFNVVQICETVLPIEAFQEDSLKEGKIVAISSEKAAELRADKPSPIQHPDTSHVTNQQKVPERQSFIGLDEIQTLVDPAEAVLLAKSIKVNRIEHEGAIKRILSIGSNLIKSNVQTKAGHFLSLISPVNKNMVTEIEVEDTTDVAPRRKKRALLPIIILPGIVFALVIYLCCPDVLAMVTSVIVYVATTVAWPFFKLFGKDISS